MVYYEPYSNFKNRFFIWENSDNSYFYPTFFARNTQVTKTRAPKFTIGIQAFPGGLTNSVANRVNYTSSWVTSDTCIRPAGYFNVRLENAALCGTI